jgi:homoserine dehydrogenase
MRSTLSIAPCRIGLAGFGTVGSAVARRLVRSPSVRHLTLTHIFDRRAGQKRRLFTAENPENPENRENPGNPEIVWTDRIDDLLTSNVDVIVEAVGGVDPAVDWMRSALLAGKSVVTSNKQAVARHGPSLQAIAARQGRQLRFEAAVGGGMPIVRALAEGLAGDRIQRIVGILNGTTNLVLSRVEAVGCSLAQALDEARAGGFAEADPSADLDGADAAAKLAILCALAFGLRVDAAAIDTHSSADLARADFAEAQQGGTAIRQLAYAAYDPDDQELTAWVAPAHVDRGSFFARTTGVRNAAVITGRFGGDVQIAGIGAGGDATAVAILSDLLAIARDRAAIVPAPALSAPRKIVGAARTAERAVHRSPDDPGGFHGFVVGHGLRAEVV